MMVKRGKNNFLSDTLWATKDLGTYLFDTKWFDLKGVQPKSSVQNTYC